MCSRIPLFLCAAALMTCVEPRLGRPDCTSTDPCRRAVFDVKAALCVEQPIADDSRCEQPCVEDGRCRAGECRGTMRDCDDRDACTHDACDPARGCVNSASALHCPLPRDPCSAPTCDRATGCGVAVVPDGTPCGSSDCRTARVCRQGTCTATTVAEGSPCGLPASICQEPGVCRAGVCAQPPARVLEPSWEYAPPVDANVAFTGTTDPEGNLYWLECRAAPCWFVSFDPSGRERYRTRLAITDPHRTIDDRLGRVIVVDGSIVVMSGYPRWIEVFRSTDGALRWRRELDPELLPHMAVGDGAGNFVVATTDAHVIPGEPADTVLLSLSTGTGRVRWQVPFEYLNSVVADELGNLYVGTGNELVSLTRDGVERWRVPADRQWPGQVHDGRLLAENLVLRAHDGGRIRLLDGAMSGVHSGAHSFVLVGDWVSDHLAFGATERGRSMYVWRAARVDWTGLEEAWRSALPWGGWGEPVLTREGRVLFTNWSHPSGRLSSLHELDAAGRTTLACPLPARGYYSSFPSLHAGRWTVAAAQVLGEHRPLGWRLLSFSVGSRSPAEVGWVMAGAHASRDGRAR